MATTFKKGDPGYAGALGGIALGLESYHILELKDEIPAEVWRAEMAFKELEMEDAQIHDICELMKEIRSDS